MGFILHIHATSTFYRVLSFVGLRHLGHHWLAIVRRPHGRYAWLDSQDDEPEELTREELQSRLDEVEGEIFLCARQLEDETTAKE